jgi:hypothetical protein
MVRRVTSPWDLPQQAVSSQVVAVLRTVKTAL